MVARVGVGCKLLIITGFITFYWGWFAQHPSLFDGKNVVNFVFLYMLGHYLRTSIVEKLDNKKKARHYFVVFYLILAGIIGMALYFSNEHVQNILKRWCYGYNSPVLVLMSVLFFLIFTTLDFKSKVINWIAASVFAVYLVHENQWFFRDLWYAMIESQYNRYPPVSFFCILLSECFLLYVIAILLDKLRNSITRRFLPIADRLQKLADLATTKMKSIWPLNQ